MFKGKKMCEKINGIDISNWQRGLIPSALQIDFCICKATEGTFFEDDCFHDFINDCVNNNLLFGFYHFASVYEPEEEAEHFYRVVKNFIGLGIPVLDYEVDNYNNCEWCEKFVNKFYELSGVYCVLYISAYRCMQYCNSWIPDKCALWVAGYPSEKATWTDEEMPYGIYPWKECSIWQFTSSLILDGYYARLDGDIAYISKAEWMKLAGSKESEDEDMHCLIKPDGKDFMVYYDGVNLHALDNEDEMKAIQEVYRKCNNKEIPVFELGTKDAPWFHRFSDAVSHIYYDPHMG